MKTGVQRVFAILEQCEIQEGATSTREGARKYLLKKTYAGVEPTKRRKIPKSWVQAAFMKQKGYCERCNEEMTLSDICGDHRVPLAKGGAHKPSNIVAMHRSCNSEKGANDLLTEAKRRGETLTHMLGEERIENE